MGSINLYKIDAVKKQMFLQELSSKMKFCSTVCVKSSYKEQHAEYGMTLYVSSPKVETEVSWSWILSLFDQEPIKTSKNRCATVLVENDENGNTYAVTFGSAFFMVDKFCDSDFGFEFARRMSFSNIKTTTLLNPSSRKNKTVNTYINLDQLFFESGESYAKIKAKAILPDDIQLFKPSIEIGSSIKFSTSDESLELIARIILFIEYIIKNEQKKLGIPVFAKVLESETIEKLDQNLLKALQFDSLPMNFSELDVIGATEIINHNDYDYTLCYSRKSKSIPCLTEAELRGFCSENGWDYAQTVLDISVKCVADDTKEFKKSIREAIDYTDDNEKCLLYQGIWYRYNDDYISYLEASIDEIETEYNPQYDFSDIVHNSFISDVFLKEKSRDEFKGKTDDEIKKSLKNRYYAENVFNIIREKEDGFQKFDRVISNFGGKKIELMDLYKNNTMFAVKIGKASSDLCYAVTQSLSSITAYRHNKEPKPLPIDTVALWLILERKKHIEDKNGNPDLKQLDMLMLLNRLDEWKKTVLLNGYRPKIYINYRTK